MLKFCDWAVIFSFLNLTSRALLEDNLPLVSPLWVLGRGRMQLLPYLFIQRQRTSHLEGTFFIACSHFFPILLDNLISWPHVLRQYGAGSALSHLFKFWQLYSRVLIYTNLNHTILQVLCLPILFFI